MEAKPKVVYSQFVAQQESKNREGTVAWIIERFIRAMNGLDGKPPVKPLGDSHYRVLCLVQRSPIGAKDARKLDRKDVIAHCQQRRLEVLPATINQDVKPRGRPHDVPWCQPRPYAEPFT